MLVLAQKILFGAIFVIALCACATAKSEMESAAAKNTTACEGGVSETLMEAKYDALYTRGNECVVLKSVFPEGFKKYEHYSLFKAPGSVYDDSWYVIQFYRDSWSLDRPEVSVESESKEHPRYWASAHFTMPWIVDRDDNAGAKVKREIHGIRLPLTDAEFASVRSRLGVEAFVSGSRNADDGSSTSHLDLYTFDLTRNGKRDVISVGWEGFDRFGEAAQMLDVFKEVAAKKFPEFAEFALMTSSAPSSSTQKEE